MGFTSKPYDNKKHFDPGRLIHKIQFMGDVAVDDGYGGSVVSEGVILETKAGKEEVSTYTQGQLNAGMTQYNNFQYFVIRNRKGFYPQKDMLINYNGYGYIIQSVKQLDDPCTFLKILCVASDSPISTFNNNDLFINGVLNDQGILVDNNIYDLS